MYVLTPLSIKFTTIPEAVSPTKNKLSEVDMALVYQAEKEVQMTVEIDDRVPDNCVLIQSSHPSQIELGGAFGSIKIKRSKA